MALLFLFAGLPKLFKIAHFRQGLLHIPYMRVSWTYLIAGGLPLLELAISAGLFMDRFPARVAAIILLLLFCLVVLVAQQQRVRVPCNCFGAESNGYLSGETIRRNLVLVGLLLPPFFSSAPGNSMFATLAAAYVIFLALSWITIFKSHQAMATKRKTVAA